jgi:hypothetical protein
MVLAKEELSYIDEEVLWSSLRIRTLGTTVQNTHGIDLARLTANFTSIDLCGPTVSDVCKRLNSANPTFVSTHWHHGVWFV